MSQINESAIKTPGVYVTEIPSFPPSIAQVATAIPAFIGYTEFAIDASGNNVKNKAVRISSLVEYTTYFGKGSPSLEAVVVLKADNSVGSVAITPGYQLFNAVCMFFNNGGADCYIISVGAYKTITPIVDITDFYDPASADPHCLDVLKKEDEPTLIVVPDAVLLGTDYYTLMSLALQQCANLQDRFTILDVPDGNKDRTFDATDVISVFRDGIGSLSLNYGAAYYPYLKTSLPVTITFGKTQLQQPAGTNVQLSDIVAGNKYVDQITKANNDFNNIVAPFYQSLAQLPANIVSRGDLITAVTAIKNNLNGFITLTGFTDTVPIPAIPPLPPGKCVNDIFTAYSNVIAAPVFSPLEFLMGQLVLIDSQYPQDSTNALGAVNAAADFPGYAIPAAADILPPALTSIYSNTMPANPVAFILPKVILLSGKVISLVTAFYNDVVNLVNGLEQQVASSSAVYANVKAAIKGAGIVVPPSGAIAGIYAAVDGTRGVWKAPANVSLNTVLAPVVNIDDDIQGDLNIDTNSGKSVNAIRAFTGKGIIVWGARTLDGNSNDFRYISVRRFYIMVEESVKKAAIQFVFEPNDGNTWVRVRAMIENYLTNLWRLGALAGSKPEQAFYVKVGLGQTMTFDDILNGKMIVEIGMAPVRPAEFIILRFSQIQQQA